MPGSRSDASAVVACAGADQIEVQGLDQAFADLNGIHRRSIHSRNHVRHACTLVFTRRL